MRRKDLLAMIALLLLSALLLNPTFAAPPAADPALAAAATGEVTLSLVGERPTLVTRQRAEGTFSSFDSTLPLAADAGAPALPEVSRLVGIPALAAPTLSVHLAPAESLGRADHPFEPAPTYRPIRGPEEDPSIPAPGVEAHYLTDAAAYSSDGWYPADPVRVSKPMQLRGQAMVRVTFTPVQINLQSGEIRYVPTAEIRLAWDASLLRAPAEPVEDRYYESFLQDQLENYDQARYWRLTPGSENFQADAVDESINGFGNTWRIQVEGTGLFRISYEELLAAGVPLNNPNELALYFGSGLTQVEQAIWLRDGASDGFGPGDHMYFINQREHGYWSTKVAYHLKRIPSYNGKRIQAQSSPPNQPGLPVETVPYSRWFEQDIRYNSGVWALDAEESWFWDVLAVSEQGTSDSFSTTFDLSHVDPTGSASITTALARFEEPYSRCAIANVTVNGAYSAQRAGWTDFSPFGQTVNMPASALNGTGNSFVINVNNCGGGVLLNFDGFTVTYPRRLIAGSLGLTFDSDRATAVNYRVSGLPGGTIAAFRIGNINTPARLTNGTFASGVYTFGRAAPNGERYLVTTLGQAQAVASLDLLTDSGLRTNLQQTDYLIITPPEFDPDPASASPAERLATHRRSQGYTARVVHTEDVYSEFGTGVPDPAAIREFLKFAYQNWNPNPNPLSFVVLVGDATYDPFDIEGSGDAVWLPPYLSAQDVFLGRVPSDNAFVSALDPGEDPTDAVPDIHIGRLPANSIGELDGMVSKLISYDSTPNPGPWQHRLLFLADNPDEAGDFHELSEGVEFYPFYPPRSFRITKGYLSPDDNQAAKMVARSTIATALNQGQLIIQYIGHAGRTQWTANNSGIWSTNRFDPISNSYTSDLALLTPNSRIPLSLAWTCWEGNFVQPGTRALAEEMMRLPGRGVIGSFSPVGLDVATAHDRMMESFYESMLTDGETQFGPLTLAAKMAVSGQAYNRLVFTYMLFGDPATHLALDSCATNPSASCSSYFSLFAPATRR